MEHLDDGAEADAALVGAAERFGGEQQQQRADALAAACDEVVGDVGDDLDVGGGLPGELAARWRRDRHGGGRRPRLRSRWRACSLISQSIRMWIRLQNRLEKSRLNVDVGNGKANWQGGVGLLPFRERVSAVSWSGSW